MWRRAWGTIKEAWHRGHKLIFITALFSLWSAVYSPLAGAYFNIAPLNISQSVPVLFNRPSELFNFYIPFNSPASAAGVCYRRLIGMLGLDTDS